MATHHDTDTVLVRPLRAHCEEVVHDGVGRLVDALVARLDDQALAKLADVVVALAPESALAGVVPLALSGALPAAPGDDAALP